MKRLTILFVIAALVINAKAAPSEREKSTDAYSYSSDAFQMPEFKMPAMPTMPAMLNMPAMPRMPPMPRMPVMPKMPKPMTADDIRNMKPGREGGTVSGVSMYTSVTYKKDVDGNMVPVVEKHTIYNDNGNVHEINSK